MVVFQIVNVGSIILIEGEPSNGYCQIVNVGSIILIEIGNLIAWAVVRTLACLTAAHGRRNASAIFATAVAMVAFPQILMTEWAPFGVIAMVRIVIGITCKQIDFNQPIMQSFCLRRHIN